MTYYSNTETELSRFGIQESELALYTGTVNPRQAETLSPRTNSKNVYVYFWRDGQVEELDACFRRDREGLDVLDVTIGVDSYTFLRDKSGGYIRQIAGPAKPIIVANLGAIPQRVDTLLGKFTVYAGSMLRLDASAPQREKRKVLLTVSSKYSQPLESAELWDGFSWRRLNICQEPITAEGDRGLAVMDGSTIVQYVAVNRKREILMMDAPEPDPDFEIYVTGQAGDQVTLRFNRTEYRDGQVVQRARTVSFSSWGETVAYDLQKLRESRTENEAHQCAIELPDSPAEPEPRPAPERRRRPPYSDKLREFLELDTPGGTSTESVGGDHGGKSAPLRPAELPHDCPEARKASVPEPPGDFPE